MRLRDRLRLRSDRKAKRHLLYIAFFYPPSRSSGVYRAHATVKSFVRKGWDVTVITANEMFFDQATGSSDWSLVDEIPEEVDVVRVPFELPSAKPVVDLRTFSWFQGNFHWLAFRLARFGPRPKKAKDVIAGRSPLAFDFVDRYVGWIDPVVKAGRRVNKDRPVDAILATGNPFSSFEAARLLSRLVGAPYAIDYRDPWALNVRTGEVLARTPGTVEAERRIVREADFAVFVNEATVPRYAAIYPEIEGKAHVFFNGWDELSRSTKVTPSSDPLRFGMLGTATDGWPLEEFFDGWRNARAEVGRSAEVVLAGYLGYFAWSASPLEDLFPSDEEGFSFVGPVAKTRVGEFYDTLDVVVILAFGGPIITAGKMYEAMAQGKPILCVQPSDGGIREVLADHPLSVCVDPNPDAIRAGLVEVASIARSLGLEERKRIRSEMEKFERLTELDRLVDRTESMLGERK